MDVFPMRLLAQWTSKPHVTLDDVLLWTKVFSPPKSSNPTAFPVATLSITVLPKPFSAIPMSLLLFTMLPFIKL